MTSSDPRSGCTGIVPLTGRLEQWQLNLCQQPDLVSHWLDRNGSPINILDPHPLQRNASELSDVARKFGVDFKIFFARKANKALAFVDEAKRLGLGIDVASERELTRYSPAGCRVGMWW